MKKLIFIAAIGAFLCCPSADARKAKPEQKPALVIEAPNVLEPAPSNAVRIDGFVGKKLDLCIENRLMKQDIDRLIQPFIDKSDGNWGFRCEFWGKWFTAAVMAYGYEPTPEHKAVVDRGFEELVKTQDADGYIGTYQDGMHLGEWDIWGRKYVLLGLIGYYDQTGNPAALEAARKEADHLIRETKDSGINIAEKGWIGWKGLPSSSVLEPIALLYQRTGDKKYLEFGEYIIKSWDTPNKLSPTGIRLIQEALNGTPLWKMSGAPKAYEMMSCYEGLCEMYRATGNKIYYEASKKLIDTIIRDEIMIVGSASMMEIWCHGKMRQTEPMYQGMETCVTATWMKYLYQMLRLTGDSKYADELEISLYNANLGAMTPNGEWWAYYSSLMGERVNSHQQFYDVGMSCCVANGPRGFMTLPSWAMMTEKKGLVVNFYGQMDGKLKSPKGNEVKLNMATAYPEDGKIKILVGLQQEENFEINLRIPSWSAKSSIRINGENYDGYAVKGTYATLSRSWKDGDVIELELDMRGRVIDAPSGVGDAAIMRGPIVLAFDTRLVPRRDGVSEPPMLRYEFERDKDNFIELKRTGNSGIDAMWMTFDVSLTDESGAHHTLPMCDYQSAGNTWQEGNLFRVWMQQPFDFRHLYTNNLDWHVNVTVGVGRPEVPDFYKIK